MDKELTGRQAIILLAISACATKLFILPSNLTAVAKQDGIYMLLVFLLVEFLLFVVLVQISYINKDKTLYELLAETVGNCVAKLVFLVLFVFFTCKLCINIVETYTFFLGTLYDELSPFLYFLPIALLIFYMTNVGLRAIGRSAEMLWVFVFIGIATIMVTALPSVDFGFMLPIFENGTASAQLAISKNVMWFGDFYVYLFFFGKIDFRKNFVRKITVVVGLTVLAIVFFLVAFYCAFPYTASMRHYAISDITQQSTRVSQIGKIDWLIVVVWTFASIIQTIIFAYCAVDSLKKVVKFKSRYVANLVFLLILGVVLFVLRFQIVNLLKMVQSPIGYTSVTLFAVSTIIIVAHFLQRRKYAKKKY